MSEKYDVIVIGGGPAGLTAAIYIARAKQKVLLIDEGVIGGQVVMSHLIANYPGVEEISGYKLGNIMKKQAKEFGADIVSNCDITKIDITGKEKVIEVDDEDLFTSDAVIIATGGTPRTLGVESEEQFKGEGISYCATCDGDFFTDKDIVVIGGGNTALEEAVSLTKYVKSVTIVHQFDHFQAYSHAIAEAEENDKIKFIMESDLVDFAGENGLEEVVIKDKKNGETQTLRVEGAFIFIGYAPNSSRFKDTINLNDRGEIISDENLATNIPGVFAAGDILEKKYRQITTAVSDGTISALSALEFTRSLSLN